ncbi:2OG-Fe(II) oxygenase [Mangrovimicrobium sediminis]|uniref:2OG-Fe(II) oxygenase n=1 Tax=Mangrovimicrobium sediminis TaxID=2562682 RepID=A0A4Z0LZZ1_9GAMM|nr:2OG-Fe(II) oxygenase [Haliea sp. SAOS-164]TGD72983.1 2OG-Fe(II) oxygenase [Haliea sp. SAOS-164]
MHNDTAAASEFYVVAREPGAEHPALPTWANRGANPAALAAHAPGSVVRVPVAGVPGAFQLHGVLAPAECQRLVELSETLGYLPDAAVSLPRNVRHNDNVVWIADDTTHALLWQRVADCCRDEEGLFGGDAGVGVNQRFRFYRYGEGDYFQPHTDGDWPGSRVIDGQLVTNSFDDRYSRMTFLIFLNEDFDGGATRFLVNADDPGQPARRGDRVKIVDLRTPAGGVLCFPHGMHPLHCLHSSEPITRGVKYIIRTDLLFPL